MANMANLKIIITSHDKREYYDQFTYSNEKDINVNSSDYGYIILFSDEDFRKLQPPVMLVNARNIIEENLEDTELLFTLMYDGIEIDQLVLMGLLRIDESLTENPRQLYPLIYIPSNQLLLVSQKVLSESDPKKNYTYEKAETPSHKKKEVIKEDLDDDIPDIMRALYDVDIPSSKKKKKKKGSRVKSHGFNYSSSRVLKAAKRPKKSFKKHGIIICNNKKAIKKDEDIIKDFLKDFIPGSSSYKKDLRKKLLKRWISSYVVSKKQATRFKKQYNKALNKSIKDQKTKQVVDMTRKILTVPIDNWNDPSR